MGMMIYCFLTYNNKVCKRIITLLAEFIQGILNSADGFVVNEIHILKNGQCADFGNDSGVQTTRYLGVISYGQELVGEL